MKTNTLSVFIEANRFPPAINPHRYSLMRAEADAVAKQNFNTLNDNNLSRASQPCAKSDMTLILAHEVHELEANQATVSSLLALPEIKPISPFNPFDEPVPSPVSPATRTESVSPTPLPSPISTTNYLPFIMASAPFDPYEETYVAHPAGEYIAYKYKDKRRITIVAPSGLPMPVTPMFFDDDRSLSTASSPTAPKLNARGPSDQALAGIPVAYAPPGSPLKPFKIARKPLPPGVRPFTPSQYPPPGSSKLDIPQTSEYSNTDTGVIRPVPRRSVRPATTDFTSRSEIGHTLPMRSSVSSRAQTVPPKTNKPLPPVPRGSRETKASSSVSQHRNNALQLVQRTPYPANRSLLKTTPLSHRANWEREEFSHCRIAPRPRSHDIETRPVTASDVFRSDMKEVGKRLTGKFFG